MSSSPTTRSALIARLHNRDDEVAWEEFVAIYTPLILRVARQRGLQEADAMEIVQEVLISVVKAINQYRRGDRTGSFRRWLMTIARNKTLNKLTRLRPDQARKHDGAELALMPDLSTIPTSIQNQFEKEWQQQVFVLAAEHVRRCVQPQTWAAFWMTTVERRESDEVAKELGMELGAIYVARSRVLAKIKAWVREQSNRWETNES